MMFYAQLFTSKRGTLAKIWLAAHWEKKITKAYVFECDLETTIQEILSPKVKIGLRTSGHLLVGVVRIYSRKTRYLLADCSDALVKIKFAFRPGQTDLPDDALEATFHNITLQEDFTDFDFQLPDLNTIDVVDHFSLNQCRTEDITLKETFGSNFLSLGEGEETHSYQGFFDQSFGVQGDCFGDEEMQVDLIDFISSSSKDAEISDLYENTPPNLLPATPPPTAVSDEESVFVRPEVSTSKMGINSPDMTETTLLVHAEEGFTLAPVVVTPSSIKKSGKRKRKLVVDRSKELTNDVIREQLADTSDLLTTLEIAPPTRQLMEWKGSGGVKQLFSCFSLPVLHPDLKKLFPRNMSPRRQQLGTDVEEQADPEEMREQTREADREETAEPVLNDWSLLQESSLEHSVSRTEPPPLWNAISEESRMDVSYPEPLSENSILTQAQMQCLLDSQDVEDKRMTIRAHKLLQMLKRQDGSPDATYSLHALCDQGCRSYAAAVFFCLLVLKKQEALNLHQSIPYSDIIATPGPLFHSLASISTNMTSRAESIITSMKKLQQNLNTNALMNFCALYWTRTIHLQHIGSEVFVLRNPRISADRPMSLTSSRRPSAGSRRRPNAQGSTRHSHGDSSLRSSSSTATCKCTESHTTTRSNPTTPRRQVKYAACSENHGIRPPAPEQYLTPLQQKEVCIRHLRARLKENVERLQNRDSEIEDLRMRLTQMQEDWIEEECHRIEAQLALKEARMEIRQLQQAVDSVRTNVGIPESEQQDCKSEGLRAGRMGLRIGASRSCGCSPAHTVSRSATYTRLSSETSPGTTDRNGNVLSERYIPANRGAMTLPRGDGRTHLLLEAALLHEQLPHTQICSGLSRSSTCERLGSGEAVLPVSRSCHAVNNNCSCGPHSYLPHHHLFLHLPQEEAPPPHPRPVATSEVGDRPGYRSQACSPTMTWISEEVRGEELSVITSATCAPDGTLAEPQVFSPSSATTSLAQTSYFTEPLPLDHMVEFTSSPSTPTVLIKPQVQQPCPRSSACTESPPQETALLTVSEEDEVGGPCAMQEESTSSERNHWSRYFLIDLLAVAVPVVPTLAWLCRGTRNEGMPMYNMGSLLRGCCAVALHSLRRVGSGCDRSSLGTGRAKPI